MTGLGVFGWVAGALQLSVPSYALRLVRRFGTQRVGWFVLVAFVSLALLHLLGPQKAFGAAYASGIMIDFFYISGSALLLIGMGHIETLFSERQQASWTGESLRQELESRVKEETVNLAKANQELIQEIGRRDQMIEALRESEAQYRFLFSENPQPMCILDLRSCRFLAVNHAALRQYGFTEEEFMTMTGRDLLLPPAAAGFLQDVSKPCPKVESRGVWQHCRKDGTLIDVEITALDLRFGENVARLILADDITQRRRREMELRRTHKLETIGQVAGGVAHHLNTILAIIEGHASAMMGESLDRKSAEQLGHISSAVTRASGLTRQMLAAGGRLLMRVDPMDLNGLIRSLNPIIRRLIGEQSMLEHAFSYLPSVLADRRLVEHVIINLVMNARDAMPRGGTLTLSTAKVRIDEDHIESGHPGRAGDFARLTVRDTGCGMTPQVQSRLFEPFFTTRDDGNSLGLGLASAHGILRQTGGWIEFSTEAGVGTEFRVFLPCIPADSVPVKEGSAQAARKGTVLLVEPDDRARALAHFVLDRHGYRVIEADCAATALVLWQGQAAEVDLLLADMGLPGDISGCELVDQLRQSKPGLKVVCTSDSSASVAGLSPDGLVFLTKPYSTDGLVEAVQRSIGC